MTVTAKWDLTRAKAKLRRWERRVDKATVRDLRMYGETAAKAMIKCTPPSHAGTTPAKALRELKARIKKDFEGDEEPYTDKDIYWVTVGGNKIARFYRKNGRPSPFRIITGRVNKQALAAMNVGRYRVQFIKQSLGGFMSRSPHYYMGRAGSSYRLKWYGVRHVTTQGAVRTEIRRRQHLAGKLMAGWKPFAKKVRVNLPGQAAKQPGKGSVKVILGTRHKAVMTASNGGHYPALQSIIDRQIPGIVQKNRRIAKKRTKQLAKTLNA